MRARAPQTLSGGEQQKLALAAIMARRPPALVLDEPLSMLDGTAAVELVAHLGELVAEGTTVVVCEHRHEYFDDIAGLRTVPLGKGPAQIPETGTPPPLAPRAPVRLEVSALSVALGERPVLNELDFAADGGEVIAIVGRNGVGKTTLLRALAGLQAHEGKIDIGDGESPDLGLVLQNADLQLFNASVRDEILFRLHDPDLAFYEWLLAALGLAHYAHTPPLLLSEGEKKRVALATVLMRLPRDGILLDEPSLGQDATHKAQLVRVARALAGTGRLVILTTHDLALATQADRLLLLGDEGFVADGPPAAVLDEAAAWGAIGLALPGWVRVVQDEMRAPSWQREPAAAGGSVAA
jgi:energy-coupling factor transport system ATP-binding protein